MNIMSKYFILFIFILFLLLRLLKEIVVPYYLQQQINENPSLLQKMNDNEVYLQNYIQNSRNNSSTIITIPVVVHVVYYNSNENISDLNTISNRYFK